jgi:hypothetical protein
MNPRVRGILGIVTGFIAASAVMMVFEGINGHVLYPELGAAAAQVNDPAQMRELMANVPTGAMLVVLAGWAVGAFVGGWVAQRIRRGDPTRTGLILGLLLTAAGVANNLMIPPPLWFWVAGMLVLLPGAWLGARVAAHRASGAPA